MTDLLDEYVPVVAGSEVNDDPFAPLLTFVSVAVHNCLLNNVALGSNFCLWYERSPEFVPRDLE